MRTTLRCFSSLLDKKRSLVAEATRSCRPVVEVGFRGFCVGHEKALGATTKSIFPITDDHPFSKRNHHQQHRCYFSSFVAPRTDDNEFDRVCELAASNLRYGPGSTAEVGQDVSDHFGGKRVVVFTDPVVRKLPCMQVVLDSLERSDVQYIIYDQVRVEPNDMSFQQAMNFLRMDENNNYDVIIALGGGSVMGTAKAANLYACFPPPDNNFYAHVNPPIGLGLPVTIKTSCEGDGESPRRLKPLICIPTTAGTGSETTGVAIFDDTSSRAKTGIASRHLKPALGIIDPLNTLTLPPTVAAYSGLDVLCHAVESYTALPFHKRMKPSSPIHRPAYQGSNPISDVWSLFALETCAKCIHRAVKNGYHDEEARSKMLLASSAAGMGFGNAGVHLCHGMSYPISSQAPDSYRCTTYPEYTQDHPLVPHGLSVIVSAPAVFSWTGVADPERHATCAGILYEARTGNVPTRLSGTDDAAGEWLADEIRELCTSLDVVTGLRQFGYTSEHLPAMVQATLPQHRVVKIAPRQPVHEEHLMELFENALDDDCGK